MEYLLNTLLMTSHETSAIIGKSETRNFFKQGGKVVNSFHSERNAEVIKMLFTLRKPVLRQRRIIHPANMKRNIQCTARAWLLLARACIIYSCSGHSKSVYACADSKFLPVRQLIMMWFRFTITLKRNLFTTMCYMNICMRKI